MQISASAKKVIKLLFSVLLILHISLCLKAQNAKGILKGGVTDGITNIKLFGVQVSENGSKIFAVTDPDGNYLIKLSRGTKVIRFSLTGYQTKIISDIKIPGDQVFSVNIILLPVASSPGAGNVKIQKNQADSTDNKDTISNIRLAQELKSPVYQKRILSGIMQGQTINAKSTDVATNRDLINTLKRLNGVTLTNFTSPLKPVSFNINGMGERYNQLMVNGTVISSTDQYSRAYAPDIIPVEMIDKVSVTNTADAALTSDYTGGTISVSTKDLPDQNFLYFQGGLGLYDETYGKNFYSDKGKSSQFFSLPGKIRSLPDGFPATRSPAALNQYNLQEQLYYSRQLKNNLVPVNYGDAQPNDKLTAGFGKIIKFKKGVKLGLTGFISQQKQEQFYNNTAEVSANAAFNPFPFTDLSKILIRSQSFDSTYIYSSQLSALLNGSLFFGKNKISVKSLYGSQLINTFSRRSGLSAPEADPTGDAGIYYKTEQRKFVNVQLSGVHALGENSKLKLDWQASYSFYRQQNPDERNFILRSDTTGNNSFEIGSRTGVASDITSSGRHWMELTEHNYTGAFNLSFPFNMFKRPQVLTGGILINNRYRILHSDFLVTKGAGYFTLDNLLAPSRYYPGGEGVSVTNYFSNSPNNNAFTRDLNDRPNYIASANLGAAYLKLQNKITNKLTANWGIRAESNTQLVSSIYYGYFASLRYPQPKTLDQNTTVNNFSLLPSLQLQYHLFKKIQLEAALYRTVNRPQLQELSIFRAYDPLSFGITTGNQQLRSTYIQNYSAGFSCLLNNSSIFSATAFYKKIDQPIEHVLSVYQSGTMLSKPYNTPPAEVKGITASLNINLYAKAHAAWLSGVNFFAGGTYLQSKVAAGPLKSTTVPVVAEHTLSGSPDYCFNTGLIFIYKNFPQFTVLYNQTGDYITAVGSGVIVKLANGNSVSTIPDYRVKAAGQLDIQLGQKIFKSKVQLTAGVNNLLNNEYTVYQDLNGNKKMDDPLLLGSLNGKQGFYRTGTDNTISRIKTQKNYFITLAFLFR